MALESPAFVISADSHSAALFRQTLQTLISGAGITEAGDLAITQNGTPNMSVNVAAGTIWMPGTLGGTAGFGNNINAQTTYGLGGGKTSQGMYCGYQDASVNLVISTADPTNPRIDLVVAAIQDAQYSGSTNTPVLQVITGTPAPSPSAPSAPASAVVLAQVAVAASVSSIVTANIADKRPVLAVNGGIVRAASAGGQRPANPVTGDYIDDPTSRLLRYNSSLGGWASPLDGGANLAAGVDLNTITSAGIYLSNTTYTNGPTNLTGYYFFLEVWPVNLGSAIRQSITTLGAPRVIQFERYYSSGWTSWVRITPESGSFTAAFSASAAASGSVTFAVPFPAAPQVVLDVAPYTGNTPFDWGITGVTATSFSYYVKNPAGTNLTANQTGRYIAMASS